jgi:hypothetical protein
VPQEDIFVLSLVDGIRKPSCEQFVQDRRWYMGVKCFAFPASLDCIGSRGCYLNWLPLSSRRRSNGREHNWRAVYLQWISAYS